MIKYSKELVACKLLSTFNIKGELKARIQELHTDKIHVVNYVQFMTNEFSLGEKPLEIASIEQDTHVAVVTELELTSQRVIEAMDEPMKVVIKATTPKGKTMKFDLDNIEDFCNKHKLDVEAVKLVLEGKQKTHKKWGFVEVE